MKGICIGGGIPAYTDDGTPDLVSCAARACLAARLSPHASRLGTAITVGLKAFVQMMCDFMPNDVHDKSIMTRELIDLYLESSSSVDGTRAFFSNLRRLNSEHPQAVADAFPTIPHESMVYATRLAETIPNARLVWIHDAGHWLIDEKPNEILGHRKELLV